MLTFKVVKNISTGTQNTVIIYCPEHTIPFIKKNPDTWVWCLVEQEAYRALGYPGGGQEVQTSLSHPEKSHMAIDFL